jgi:hypothetical protein
MAWGDSLKTMFTADESGRALCAAMAGGIVGGVMLVMNPPSPGSVGATAAAAVINATPVQIFNTCFMGAVMAVVGVVLILNVDQRNWLRVFATSVLCGYFWPTILSGAASVITKTKGQ